MKTKFSWELGFSAAKDKIIGKFITTHLEMQIEKTSLSVMETSLTRKIKEKHKKNEQTYNPGERSFLRYHEENLICKHACWKVWEAGYLKEWKNGLAIFLQSHDNHMSYNNCKTKENNKQLDWWNEFWVS